MKHGAAEGKAQEAGTDLSGHVPGGRRVAQFGDGDSRGPLVPFAKWLELAPSRCEAIVSCPATSTLSAQPMATAILNAFLAKDSVERD